MTINARQIIKKISISFLELLEYDHKVNHYILGAFFPHKPIILFLSLNIADSDF